MTHRRLKNYREARLSCPRFPRLWFILASLIYAHYLHLRMKIQYTLISKLNHKIS